MTTRRKIGSAIVVLALSMSLPTAHAQETEAQRRARAAEHFDRGIAFYNEQRFDAALAEFSQAYEIFPAGEPLYNIARVHAALGHAVEAADAYQRYLSTAGNQMPPRRRREVQQALDQQRSRIGFLMVRTDVNGATIAIDGVDRATTPLSAPIALAAGVHRVELRAAGRETVRREVSIAGRSETPLQVSLREEIVPRGTLRVIASLPEVGISVDGEAVGVTPLDSTLSLRAGEHAVRATRPGYVSQTRSVMIEAGADAEVRFTMRRAPRSPSGEMGRLVLSLPSAAYVIRVDGESMMGMTLELPIGAHRIEIEVTDRAPYEGTVHIGPRATLSIAPPLAWTLEERRARIENAEELRGWGIGLTLVGGALLVASAGLLAWTETTIPSIDMRIADLETEIATFMSETPPPGCASHGDPPECDEMRAELTQRDYERYTHGWLRFVEIGGIVLGGVLAIIGVPLWVSAPSAEEIDASARARAALYLGPGRLDLIGAF